MGGVPQRRQSGTVKRCDVAQRRGLGQCPPEKYMLKCGEKDHTRQFANVLLAGVDKRFEQSLKTLFHKVRTYICVPLKLMCIKRQSNECESFATDISTKAEYQGRGECGKGMAILSLRLSSFIHFLFYI